MRLVTSFVCLCLAAAGSFLIPSSSYPHQVCSSWTLHLYRAFPESTVAFKAYNYGSGFHLSSADCESQASLLLLNEFHPSATLSTIAGERNWTTSRPQPEGINCLRASLLGTANAGAIFFGFKQAIQSWGKAKGGFHFKSDWKGDNLAQIDELSHLAWGYRMTQFLRDSYRWAGFSSRVSHIISISQTALVLTLVEYPIDAYNPKQGFGVSDLVFDYIGIGLAWMKECNGWLEDFDIKISSKTSVFLGNQPLFAQTYEEFDNLVYWLTYKRKFFLPQKILCFGLGYSVTHRNHEPERQFFLGIGLSLSDLTSLFGEKLKRRFKLLGIIYPNLSLRL